MGISSGSPNTAHVDENTKCATRARTMASTTESAPPTLFE